MAKMPAKTTRFWVDHRNWSGYLNAVDMDVTQELPNANTFQDNGPRVVVGNYGHKHALRGFFDGSSSQIDAVSDTLLGTTSDHYLAELFGGTTEQNIVYESIVQMSGKPIKAAVGGAVMLDVPLEGAGGASRSMILRNATLGASDTGISVDQGANTTVQTYQATFRFFAGTFTNAVLQVQDSSNGTTWGDSTGLTATATGNLKAVRTTSAAALRQYKRVICTTLVGSADVEIAVTGGVVAGA